MLPTLLDLSREDGSAILPVGGPDHGLDSTPHVEVSYDLAADWPACLDDVIEDPVRDMFMEDPLIPERVDVKLQRLQLDDPFQGNVGDSNRGEVRLRRS